MLELEQTKMADSDTTKTAEKTVTNSNAKTEDRASEVLNCAARLFHQKGFDATSMNDIASAVGLTKAGLYYYTKGKEDLLFDIISSAMDRVERDIIEPAHKIQDPDQRLRFVMESHIKAIFASGGRVTILAEQTHKLSAEQKQKIIDRQRVYLDAVKTALKELSAQGRLRSCDIGLAAMNLFGTIVGVARWHKPEGRLTNDQVITETVNFVMAGLVR